MTLKTGDDGVILAKDSEVKKVAKEQTNQLFAVKVTPVEAEWLRSQDNYSRKMRELIRKEMAKSCPTCKGMGYVAAKKV